MRKDKIFTVFLECRANSGELRQDLTYDKSQHLAQAPILGDPRREAFGLEALNSVHKAFEMSSEEAHQSKVKMAIVSQDINVRYYLLGNHGQ